MANFLALIFFLCCQYLAFVLIGVYIQDPKAIATASIANSREPFEWTSGAAASIRDLMEQADVDALRARVSGSTVLAEAVAGCDLVVEAVPACPVDPLDESVSFPMFRGPAQRPDT